MKLGNLAVVGGTVLATSLGGVPGAAAQAGGRGTIRGHVRLVGELPGNPVMRMGRDPMCARINAGKRVIQETVMAALDGSVANVFVQLEGSFPDSPVPTEPVIIDQRGCVYTPRVVGVRLGQILQVPEQRRPPAQRPRPLRKGSGVQRRPASGRHGEQVPPDAGRNHVEADVRRPHLDARLHRRCQASLLRRDTK